MVVNWFCDFEENYIYLVFIVMVIKVVKVVCGNLGLWINLWIKFIELVYELLIKVRLI